MVPHAAQCYAVESQAPLAFDVLCPHTLQPLEFGPGEPGKHRILAQVMGVLPPVRPEHHAVVRAASRTPTFPAKALHAALPGQGSRVPREEGR